MKTEKFIKNLLYVQFMYNVSCFNTTDALFTNFLTTIDTDLIANKLKSTKQNQLKIIFGKTIRCLSFIRRNLVLLRIIKFYYGFGIVKYKST